MSGYYGYSKSNNAITAEDSGLRTASKLAKYLSKNYKKYKYCTAKDISDTMPPEEWHHTSSWYNETNYYNIIDLIKLKIRIDLQKSIQKRLSCNSETYYNCVVSWWDWYGTRKRPKKIEQEEKNCTVIFNGKSTYKIIFKDKKTMIKRKGTKGLLIQAQDKNMS